MNRRNLLTAASLILTLSASAKEQTLPNVVLLVVDDMGYNDMSFRETALSDVKKYGTPAIDALAQSGAYFANGYATCPISSPARNGILTGCYQERWGNYGFGDGGLDPNRMTIAQYLKALGYATKHIGKVHLNGGPVEHPMDHGFDEFMGFINHSWDYKRLSEKDKEAVLAKGAKEAEVSKGDQALGALWRDRDPQGVDIDSPDAYTTEVFTDEAIEFMERKSSKEPFFIQLAYNALHSPTYVVDEKYAERVGLEYTPWDREAESWDYPYWDPSKISKYDFHQNNANLKMIRKTGRKRYLSQLLALDDSVAAIREKLKELGELDNTIIVFVSDNGGELSGYSNNDPLNGQKYMLGEGGIRIPMMISYPDQIKPNRATNSIVSAMDIFPTIVAYTGGEAPEFDGKSLVPVIKKPKTEIHDVLAWDVGTILSPSATEPMSGYAVRKGDWKMTYNCADNHISWTIDDDGYASYFTPLSYPTGLTLHNLKDDPQELRDLSKENPEKLEELLTIYKEWRAQMPDPIKMR
ncbi:MAG: sulfatase-like hydrolase/transferase [Rikenellaceae bacterium]